MSAPFLPLTRPTIDDETIAGVAEVLRSGWITSGPKVKELEARLSEHCGGRPVRLFNSGTCTMEIALRIAGIGAGHEVITTPLSWVATSNVILEVGARPVFVDIDPVTRNIDLDRIETAITPATRAILPVDLAGLPVDRDRLYAIARKHRLRVVEDSAQSFGSTWNGKRIGSFGDFISFSFHPNKNITTIEGGALVLNDEREAKLAEQYRLQGVVRTGFDGMEVEIVGGKFNLSDVAARVGLGQLPHLEKFNARRRELARAYFEEFSTPAVRALGLQLPPADFAQSNWHMFQVVLPEERISIRRGDVMAKLHAMGIGTGVHYPAIHLFAVYRRLGWKEGDFPIAERVCRNILTLPLFPAMTRGDVARVVETLTGLPRGSLQIENLRTDKYGKLENWKSSSAFDLFPVFLLSTFFLNPGVSTSAPVALSVVIPVYNEELNLPVLFARLYPVLDALGRRYEVIFVNDGSADHSMDLLRAQHAKRPEVTRVVDFNANYTQHMAIMAAFERLRGDVTVTLDADLQNPPKEIPKLLALIDLGHDYVGGYRLHRQDSFFRTFASKIINLIREKTTSIEMTDQGCMLRAYRRPIIDAIVRSGAINTFIPALAYSFSGNPAEVGVRHEERHAGVSNYSFYKLIRLNFDLITGFSLAPLQAFTMFAMACSAGSFVLVLILAGRRIFIGPEEGGTFTLFGILFFLLSVTMVGIGLIGEYVGRSYQVVRARQRYHVRESLEAKS